MIRVDWIGTVWDDPDVRTTNELAVMLVVASFLDRHGRCRLSLENIAKLARVSKRTVQNVVDELVGRGKLTKVSSPPQTNTLSFPQGRA